MCTYLHGPRLGGTYYFRMGIPEHLRPIMGKREFFFSLKTKDRAEAKRRVLQVEAPYHVALLEKAQAELAGHQPAVSSFDPFAGMTLEQFERHQQHDGEQFLAISAEDDRAEEAQKWAANLPADHPGAILLKEGAYDRLTAKWGEWFGPYLRKVCMITDKRKVFHSFRHTFKHFAGHVGMIEGVQRDIMGHSPGDVADDYRGGYSKHQLVEGMKLYRITGLALSRVIIQRSVQWGVMSVAVPLAYG